MSSTPLKVTVTIKYPEPVPPPVVTVEMTLETARRLRSALGEGSHGPGSILYRLYGVLYDALNEWTPGGNEVRH